MHHWGMRSLRRAVFKLTFTERPQGLAGHEPACACPRQLLSLIILEHTAYCALCVGSQCLCPAAL